MTNNMMWMIAINAIFIYVFLIRGKRTYVKVISITMLPVVLYDLIGCAITYYTKGMGRSMDDKAKHAIRRLIKIDKVCMFNEKKLEKDIKGFIDTYNKTFPTLNLSWDDFKDEAQQ